MKIGVFGGSFDPVHLGHLLLAEQCLAAAQLDLIKFIPAAISPFKQDNKPSDAQFRVEMLSLAIAGHEKFEIDTIEIERAKADNADVENGDVSYTVDTLTQLQQNTRDAEWFLLMGGDSLIDFHAWKEPKRICELATPIIVRRPPLENVDFDLLADLMSRERLDRVKELSFRSLQIEISSTSIRHSVKNGQSIRFQTTRAVEEFIHSKKLYL